MPNMKLSQYKNYFLILLIILVPSVFAQQKTQNKLVVAGKIGNNQILYKADKYGCYKINSISESFAEKLAAEYRVSASSIEFRRVVDYKFDSCKIMVDTPIGPKKCVVYTLVKVKNDFIVTPLKVFDDGGFLNMINKEGCSYD